MSKHTGWDPESTYSDEWSHASLQQQVAGKDTEVGEDYRILSGISNFLFGDFIPPRSLSLIYLFIYLFMEELKPVTASPR